MQVPLNDLLYALSRALDCVEQDLLGVTSNHGKRVAYVSMQICRAMGLSDPEVFDMVGCAILHDNALTAYMLEAGPGDISRLEHFPYHCTRGEENAMAFPFAGDCSGIVLHHHENWDGSGFHKLAGSDIPLRASILRLADNMDLCLRMGDSRPGLDQEMRSHALEHSGTLYAPATVDAFLDIVSPDFVLDLSNQRIGSALAANVPNIRVDLSTEQLLKVCSIFAFIIDAKSPFTKNHSSGLAEKISQLAQNYGIQDEHRDKLMIAAYLHDVGKLVTPLTILEKPASLSEEEFAVMRQHANMTWEILKEVHGLKEITAWSANHHEKLNGSGYPYGHTQTELPFECRLMGCCDVYQALTEDRPYRASMNHEQAMCVLNEMAERGELDNDIVRTIGMKLGNMPK